MDQDGKEGENLEINEIEGGVVLKVYVRPRSKDFRIAVEGKEIVVFCREEPIMGKVNKELVKEFSRLLHKKVELISGFTSRQKKLLIKEAGKSEVEKVLLRE